MKKSVKAIALTLVAATVFTLTGCTPKYEALTSKDFKKALENTLDMEEDKDYRVIESEDGEIEKMITSSDGDVVFTYMEFDKEKHALKYFEKTYYDDYMDMINDKEFDGKQKNYYNADNYTGFMVFDGENDDGDEIYGGVYLKDKTIVVAISVEGNKNDKKDVKSLIDAIGYPSI